jgi:PPOX class probable F420-dependent enzyme
MSVRLTEEEAWQLLASSHTGIVTTLRRDGWPVSLPVWFAVLGRAIYFRTPSRTRKVERLRRDDRVSFLVEGGLAWKELRAVVVTGRGRVLETGEESQRALEAIHAKYDRFRTAAADMPERTRRHYSTPFVVIRIDPVQPLLTWDNARLRLRSDAGGALA